MSSESVVEFYDYHDNLVASVDSAMVPPVGSHISIAKKTYSVRRVTYAVDNAHTAIANRTMRANVDVVEDQPCKS